MEHQGTANSDSGSRHEVYDGLRIRLTPAPLGKRVLAYMIDLGIIYAIIYPFILVSIVVFVIVAGISHSAEKFIERLSGSGAGGSSLPLIMFGLMILVVLLGLLCLNDGFFVYYEYTRGATPGKKLFGLKVVSRDGGPLTLGQAIFRSLMRYVDCWMVLPGLITVLATERSTRLGDLLASTLVVHSFTAEQNSNFFYIRPEDYQALLPLLQPEAMTDLTSKQFLAFAFSRYGRGVWNPNELTSWYAWLDKIFPSEQARNIDPETKLRFLAEYCSQQRKLG